MLTIRTIPGAPLETNCYLIADTLAGDGLIIDAPKQVAEPLLAFTTTLGITVQGIICTHGHWDHSMGLPELLAVFPVPVACHAMDAHLLEHPTFEPFSFSIPLTPVTPNRLLAEGDEIAVGAARFTILHTPGHTPGGICLYCAEEQLLFSGDTLFQGTYGRIDFPGGDMEAMITSLQRLRALPAATRVFPGHGPETTIGQERGWLTHIEEMEES